MSNFTDIVNKVTSITCEGIVKSSEALFVLIVDIDSIFNEEIYTLILFISLAFIRGELRHFVRAFTLAPALIKHLTTSQVS